MKKNYPFLFLLIVFTRFTPNLLSTSEFKVGSRSYEAFAPSAAFASIAFGYSLAQAYFKSRGYAFSTNQEVQAQMLKMSNQEWRSFVEASLLNGKNIESLTFAERQKLFTEYELYQYDGYRLLIASLPEFKNFVMHNARYPNDELKKHLKKTILYSKDNLKLISKYYRGEITLSQQEINGLPDTLKAEQLEAIICKEVPRTIGQFILEEEGYITNPSGPLDPRQTPLGLSYEKQQELARNIKNNFQGIHNNNTLPAPQVIKQTEFKVLPVLSQDTLHMCEEKNIDINLFSATYGTVEQSILHQQFIDIINKSATIYVRYENYSEVKKLALGATQYSLAGISLTKSNNMPLAQAAHRTASSIIALLDGVREACGDKLSQVYNAVKNPVQFGREVVDLALNASSEIALFTTQALKDPEVQKTILTIIADQHPSFAINSIIATKVCKELDAYMQTHTVEQAAHALGKEATDLVLDAVIFNVVGRAVKTLKITQKLGYVGRQAAKLAGYSVINRAESLEKAALLLAEASPEALAVNPIVRAAVASEIECTQSIKEIGFKTLPKTVSPIVEELVAANGLPKSFIPGPNSLTLALQENGVYELSKTADIFGNNWQKIKVAGDQFWQITPATAKGREFLLQAEKELIQSPEAMFSIEQIVLTQSPVFIPAVITDANIGIPQKTARIAEYIEIKDARYITLQTGERCRIPYPEDVVKAETIWADQKWEEIRTLTDDVQKIAQNVNMPEHKIQHIKKHLFYNEHILRAGITRFDPDAEIAAAWDRLYKGDFVRNDIQLLEHEYFESNFERLFKTDYDTAHAAAQNRLKGRYWESNK